MFLSGPWYGGVDQSTVLQVLGAEGCAAAGRLGATRTFEGGGEAAFWRLFAVLGLSSDLRLRPDLAFILGRLDVTAECTAFVGICGRACKLVAGVVVEGELFPK